KPARVPRASTISPVARSCNDVGSPRAPSTVGVLGFEMLKSEALHDAISAAPARAPAAARSFVCMIIMAQYPRSMLKKNCRLLGYGARSMNRLKFWLPKLLNSGSKLQYFVCMNGLRAWKEKRRSRARANE